MAIPQRVTTMMPRLVARRIPTCIALTAHFVILYTLVYDPTVKLVVGEQPGPALVEIVVVPSHGSTFVEHSEVAEPTSTELAELPPPTLAEEPPPEISEQGEAGENPVALPAPSPKRAAVHKASASPVPPAVSSGPPHTSVPIMGASGVPDQPEMGASDTDQASVGVSHAWKARLLSHLERYKRYPSEAV